MIIISIQKKGKAMRQTFGNMLLQFANSVDILEEENFKKIQRYIEEYLATVLHIRFVRLGGEVMLIKYSLIIYLNF